MIVKGSISFSGIPNVSLSLMSVIISNDEFLPNVNLLNSGPLVDLRHMNQPVSSQISVISLLRKDCLEV